MKALTWLGPRQMEVQELAEPSPKTGEALLKVAAVGICGSELEGYLGASSIRQPPQIFGHEFVGTVVEVGEGSRFQTGTRVVVNPLLSCGNCPMCQRDAYNLCVNRELIGAQHPGGMADYVVVPEHSLFEVPETISDLEASLTEPLAVAIHAVELAKFAYLERAVVMGAGNIGLLVLQALRQAGVHDILVLDTHAERRKTAIALGASHARNPLQHDAEALLESFGNFGVDVVIDCVGKAATRKLAQELVRPGGRVVLLGLHDALSELHFNDVVRWEVSILGSYTYTELDFRNAIKTFAKGAIDASAWTELRPLEEGGRSFEEMIDHPSVISKYVLKP